MADLICLKNIIRKFDLCRESVFNNVLRSVQKQLRKKGQLITQQTIPLDTGGKVNNISLARDNHSPISVQPFCFS